MRNALVPCSSCRRHVRTEDAVCAFCAAPLAVRGGVTRVALAVALGAGVAMGCAENSRLNAPLYGGPPPSVERGDAGGEGTDNPNVPAPTPTPTTSGTPVVPTPTQEPPRAAPAYGLPPRAVPSPNK